MIDTTKIRKRFYIHTIQRKYAFLTFLLLASYTAVLALALFLPPSLKLMGGASLEEQVSAASQFIALSDRLWPAVLVGVPLFMVLSVLATHKLAGPVYRLEQSLKQIADGDLGFNVRFRAGDDLQELAVLLNQIIYRQGEALKTVRSVHQRLLETMGEVRSKHPPPERIGQMLEPIQLQIEQLETLLRQFKTGLPEPSAAPAAEPSPKAASAGHE